MLHPLKLPRVVVRALNSCGFHTDEDVAERLATQRRREQELVVENERLVELIVRTRDANAGPARHDIDQQARALFDVHGVVLVEDADERTLTVYVVAWRGFDVRTFREWLRDAIPVSLGVRIELVAHDTEYSIEGSR